MAGGLQSALLAVMDGKATKARRTEVHRPCRL